MTDEQKPQEPSQEPAKWTAEDIELMRALTRQSIQEMRRVMDKHGVAHASLNDKEFVDALGDLFPQIVFANARIYTLVEMAIAAMRERNAPTIFTPKSGIIVPGV